MLCVCILLRVKGFIYATPTLERDPPHTYKLVLVAKGTVAGANETTTETGQELERDATISRWCAVHMPVHTPCICSIGTVLVPVLVAPLSSSRA